MFIVGLGISGDSEPFVHGPRVVVGFQNWGAGRRSSGKPRKGGKRFHALSLAGLVRLLASHPYARRFRSLKSIRLPVKRAPASNVCPPAAFLHTSPHSLSRASLRLQRSFCVGENVNQFTRVTLDPPLRAANASFLLIHGGATDGCSEHAHDHVE